MTWIVPILGTAFVGAGMMAIFVNPNSSSTNPYFRLMQQQIPTQAYLVDAFPEYSASAVAANTVLRSVVGSFLPLAGPRMYSSLRLGWVNSLLAFNAIILIPFPVFLIVYGERLRKLG